MTAWAPEKRTVTRRGIYGSNSWKELENQVLCTKEAAAEIGAKVRYYVDDISKEARELLENNASP